MIFRNQLSLIAQNQPKRNLKELAFYYNPLVSPSLSVLSRGNSCLRKNCVMSELWSVPCVHTADSGICLPTTSVPLGLCICFQMGWKVWFPI